MSRPRVKVLSSGGGLDSFAMLLDALERGEKPDVVVFADVGDAARLDPAEWPGTYRHLHEVVAPLCAREGIEFVILDTVSYPVRGARSLFAWLHDRQQIPVAGPKRICTRIAKVERFEAWMDARWPGEDVEVWIGFEAGEESRIDNDPNASKPRQQRKPTKKRPNPPLIARRHNRFPLMEQGICRCRAEALVRRLGYPIPRKSACVYCPYGSKGDWQTFARELPEEFARVAELEARKPPTEENGRKLSIMAFRSFEKKPEPKRTRLNILRDKNGFGYSAPTVNEFIQGGYKPTAELCGVCRTGIRATKATACGYLDEAAA